MKSVESANMSRRSFLTAAAGTGAVAALGIAGVSSAFADEAATEEVVTEGAATEEAATEEAATEEAAATETTETTESESDLPEWVGEDPEIADSDIVEVLETDLLIVGAGNGGMMAAACASDAGLDFVICEKSSAMADTRHWIGVVNSSLTEEAGVTVDKGMLLNELTRYASGNCDQSVWNVWINESADMFEYLNPIMEAGGLSVTLDAEGCDNDTGGTSYYVPALQHMWYQPDLGYPLLTGMEYGDSDILRNPILERYIQEAGHEVSYGYEMVKLLREDEGAVTGAIFSTSDGYVQINANNVLLTTGGYAANPVMVQARNPVVDECVTGAYYNPTCTGDGIKCAMRIGADMDAVPAAMVFDRGAVLPGTDAGYVGEGEDATLPSPLPMCMFASSQPFLKVNRNGDRFMNESVPYDTGCHMAGKQPGGVYCMIFDSNCIEDMERFETIGCSKGGVLIAEMAGSMDAYASVFEDAFTAGLIVKADTIEELAEALELPYEELQATIDRYNELYELQEDEDFGKEAYRLSSISEAPYYGLWLGGNILTTIDGLCINANMQVLDSDSEPIEGLYAAGDCSGSLFAGNYPEYLVGNACGRTLTFARHAVQYIASQEA